MNEKFFDLSREKQDRMINGAIEVFAKNGFKHASTDDMVEAVHVSKGLWFHYFGSKVGIYEFVYGYSVKYFILELASVLDSNEKDFFEITKQIEFAKMRVSKNYPYMIMFLENARKETDEQLIAKTMEERMILDERLSALIKQGEIEGIAEKSYREKIKQVVRHTINGIVMEKAQAQAEPEAAYREIKSYIEFIRDMSRPQEIQVADTITPDVV